MKNAISTSVSEAVRQHAVSGYLSPARRRRQTTFSVNVGAVHSALKLDNRVPQVCNALGSKKFLTENHLRLVSKTGPPSGQSTTVTYTYELVETEPSPDQGNAWERLRGALKDVYAEFGGGEAYLRAERASLRDASERK